MGAEMINHGSSLPLYEQVANDLRRRIEAGELAGRSEPLTDGGLAADYRVAIGTVRKALRILRAEDLVRTRHGRGSSARPPGGWPG